MAIGIDSPTLSKRRRMTAQMRHRMSLGISLEGPFFTADLDKTLVENARKASQL